MEKKCEVKDCNGVHVAQGLCEKHYRRLKKHGHLKTTRPADWGLKEKHPLYSTWSWIHRMKAKFGVCPDWEDFWKFVADVGERPSPNHQLRRKDSQDGYSPETTYWLEVSSTSDRTDYQKEWRASNPDKVKNTELRKRFGITLEDYNKMFEDQKGVCCICSNPQLENHGSLAVDHCHTTGKVRGLLCTNCNKGLGHFKDSLELLDKAKLYLQERN